MPPGLPGRHYLLTNIGSNTARIGILTMTLLNAGSGTNISGECDLLAGESIPIERASAGFVYKSTLPTTLRLTSAAG
jgi:hypothetical protein